MPTSRKSGETHSTSLRAGYGAPGTRPYVVTFVIESQNPHPSRTERDKDGATPVSGGRRARLRTSHPEGRALGKSWYFRSCGPINLDRRTLRLRSGHMRAPVPTWSLRATVACPYVVTFVIESQHAHVSQKRRDPSTSLRLSAGIFLDESKVKIPTPSARPCSLRAGSSRKKRD
jgi:hypothetical protein